MNNLKALCFKKLDKLKPTIHSCTMKMIEEFGEFFQHYAKGIKASGELNTDEIDPVKLIGEAADMAQSATTMMYAIAEEYDLDLVEVLSRHETKLKIRGYLS